MDDEVTPLMGRRASGVSAKSEGNGNGNGDEGGHFKSTFGMIMSCLSCMVGAGNVWRFPRIAANNSGDKGALQFVLVWALFLFLWSIPMLVIEYAAGRYCKCSPVGIFKKLLGPKYVWLGIWVTAVSTAIGCYYSVLCSWCFYYLYYSIAFALPTTEVDSYETFLGFAEDSYWVLLPQAVAIILSGVALLYGVKSIEKVMAFLVPTYLLLLIFTFVWALFLPYASYGLKFLFTPDWSKLKDPKLWIDAASQNAFDTGGGWGLMSSYSAFMTRNNGIVKLTTMIPVTNNLLSLLSAMGTFSTVFSVEMSAGVNHSEIVEILQHSGPANTGLTFIWIPILYSTITGGRILAIIFFFALSLALLTTEIAILELAVKSCEDLATNMKRTVIVPVVCSFTFLIGIGSALDIDYLVNQDFVWSNALLLSGVAFMFIVWKYGSSKFRSVLINDFSVKDWNLPIIWEWMIKFLLPLEVFILIVWFAIDEILSNIGWYRVDGDNLMSSLVQWSVVILLSIVINYIYIKYFMAPANPADENAMSGTKRAEQKFYESIEEPNKQTGDSDRKTETGYGTYVS